MSLSFEDLEKRLEQIDPVLNEKKLAEINRRDIEKGFDPIKDYDPDELRGLGLSGIDALKKTGESSRYILLEVVITEGDKKKSFHYLRGFDYPLDSHPVLAAAFLRNELCPTLNSEFTFPLMWPSQEVGRFRDEVYDKKIESVNGDITVTVVAHGGGLFTFEGSNVILAGKSMAFGRLLSSPPYVFLGHDRSAVAEQLFTQLFQRETYRTLTPVYK